MTDTAPAPRTSVRDDLDRYPESAQWTEGDGGSLVPAPPGHPRAGAIPPQLSPELRDAERAAAEDRAVLEERITKAVTAAVLKVLRAEGLS